ncbi:hypothetical protein BCR34DRAFT_592475 [Clohesyomyces aquaticus]|uniref:Uncharacterized protein n=1 Tax=Clohesyomyces aquaticus TaxID=1231657 RepID=A0A1Y1YRU2_9PLEO|nr:hypothetical protein BCR34DRAFT_592475 [Clohesyomyces aquaticus]
MPSVAIFVKSQQPVGSRNNLKLLIPFNNALVVNVLRDIISAERNIDALKAAVRDVAPFQGREKPSLSRTVSVLVVSRQSKGRKRRRSVHGMKTWCNRGLSQRGNARHVPNGFLSVPHTLSPSRVSPAPGFNGRPVVLHETAFEFSCDKASESSNEDPQATRMEGHANAPARVTFGRVAFAQTFNRNARTARVAKIQLMKPV